MKIYILLLLASLAIIPACSDDSTTPAAPPLMPSLSHTAGFYSNAISVTISHPDSAVSIIYTTNSNYPAMTNSGWYQYSSPLIISDSLLLKAAAYSPGGTASQMTQAFYSIDKYTAPVTFSPDSITTNRTFQVTISCITPGAGIRYTMNGSDPTETTGTIILSGGTVSIESNLILKAIAYKAGYTNSPVKSATYTLTVTPPTFSIPDGTIISLNTLLRFTNTNPGATIRYTTNGDTPSAVTGTIISSGSGVSIRNTTLIKAVAYLNDNATSEIVSNLITMKHTIAGTSSNGYSGDGSWALDATLDSPRRIWYDNGYVYFSDYFNDDIRRFTPGGNIETIAGGNGSGYTGDGGPATAARLRYPSGICVYNGYVYVADKGNHVIRRFQVGGNIETIAGTGSFGYTGDGFAATDATFRNPEDVHVYDGVVYVADTDNNAIRKFTVGGNISTITGGNGAGYSGDSGFAVDAQLDHPGGICVQTNRKWSSA